MLKKIVISLSSATYICVRSVCREKWSYYSWQICRPESAFSLSVIVHYRAVKCCVHIQVLDLSLMSHFKVQAQYLLMWRMSKKYKLLKTILLQWLLINFDPTTYPYLAKSEYAFMKKWLIFLSFSVHIFLCKLSTLGKNSEIRQDEIHQYICNEQL